MEVLLWHEKSPASWGCPQNGWAQVANWLKRLSTTAVARFAAEFGFSVRSRFYSYPRQSVGFRSASEVQSHSINARNRRLHFSQ